MYVFQFTGVQSSMERRRPMYPKLGIQKPLERFQPPPSQPPKGKEVMERFFDVIYSQDKNDRSADSAAATVTKELLDLWELGDARIPLNSKHTIKRRILTFRDDLGYLNKEKNETRPKYKTTVRERGHLKIRVYETTYLICCCRHCYCIFFEIQILSHPYFPAGQIHVDARLVFRCDGGERHRRYSRRRQKNQGGPSRG